VGIIALRHAVYMVDDTPRPYRIEDLLRVMARLRDPEMGCP
jgi:hypothetical protein